MNDITYNSTKNRFELFLDPEYAYMECRWFESNLALMHTFVPESHRGQGIADRLAKFAFEHVESNKIKAIVYCPFVTTYLQRHPEYAHLVTVIKRKE